MFQADRLKKGYLALMCSAARYVRSGEEKGEGSGVMSALNSQAASVMIIGP